MPQWPARFGPVVSVLTLLIVGLSACGDSGSDDSGPDDEAFAVRAARECTDIINTRDHAVFEAAAIAGPDVIKAIIEDEPLDDATRATMATAYSAAHDALRDARDRLDALASDDPVEQAAWTMIVAAGDARIDHLGQRAALLTDADWDTIVAQFTPFDADSMGVAFAEALATLGLEHRDCEVVFVHAGHPEEHTAFIAAAAPLCSRIVERRAAEGFDTDLILQAILEAHRDGRVEPSDALRTQLEAVVQEWERTQADLATIDAASTPDPDSWSEAIETAGQRVQMYQARLDALSLDDETAMAQVFTANSGGGSPVLWELRAFGLEQRDCRAITS